MKSGIYQIINILNRKIYVGSTNDFKDRKSEHFSALRSNRHDNPHLQNAWTKYGPHVWSFEILEFAPVEKLEEVEQKYLNLLWDGGKTCYNIAKYVRKPSLGLPKSKETKRKMSLSKKGRKFTDEHKRNLSFSHLGQRASEHQKQVCRDRSLGNKFSLGHKHSNETKRKMSEAKKKRNLDLFKQDTGI